MGSEKQENAFLTGKLLLAMPAMGDPRFHKAVIYICAHDENGAMGLVINHTLPGVELTALLKQLKIESDNPEKNILLSKPVMSGGPVETARGFVLHTNDFTQDDTIKIKDGLCVTGTIDALKAIADGSGPEKMLFMLGYAGWSAEQLDEEIQDNAWLVVDPDSELIFKTSADEKWNKALSKIGIDPAMLSGSAGRA